MRLGKVWVVFFLFFILIMSGCTKATTSDKEQIEIKELATKMNIAVRPSGNEAYLGRNDWTIAQIKKNEVYFTNAGAKALNDLGIPGDLIYDIWYGQDDLTTFKEAIKEGTTLGLSRFYKKFEEVQDTIDAKKDVEDIKDGALDTLDYYTSNEDITQRTIKVFTYAFIDSYYDTVPFGVWKGFIEQPRIQMSVEKRNNELFYYGYDINKNTFFTRTYYTFQYFNGQQIKSFPTIKSPVVTSDNNDKLGAGVAANLRKLAWDVYCILDGKEPTHYPEYSKALVASFEREEKANKEQMVDMIVEASKEKVADTVVEENRKTDPSSKKSSSDALLKLTWGMELNEVKKIFPESTVATEQSGSRHIKLKENRYASTSCVVEDTIFFSFKNNKLDSITYGLDLNKDCNLEDLNKRELVKKGYKELYKQIIRDYDPTNQQSTVDLGNHQEWSNQNTAFELGFWVALDQNGQNQAMPYATFTITKEKEGAPIVMLSEPNEEETSQDSQKESEVEERTKETKKPEPVHAASNKQEFIKKLNDIEKGLSDLKHLYKSGTTVDMLSALYETHTRWDDVLNEIYGVLKKQLTPNEMSELKQEQLKWIKHRDETAKNNSLEFQGGTMAEVLLIDTKAQLTKERSYELVNLYMK
ncbi:lysozyme inhibitor LprI family protein [Virgibacillus sp. DJP39]|uniref:lysozyme inhibitor LprI family protein n=1 Tax=Virgibacillus sp. DJP39 TaxID=3409790 RepID=UPI003BB4B233